MHISQTIAEKKNWLIENAGFHEVEFTFFSLCPSWVQTKMLDSAIEYYQNAATLQTGSHNSRSASKGTTTMPEPQNRF